jgi:hypothetical protein
MNQAGTMAQSANIPGGQRFRRWRLWLGVPLLLFVVWLVIVCGFFVYWTDRDLREAMAAAELDSPNGWQLEDIEARREQVPDDENAALVVMKIKSLLPPNWPRDVTPSVPAALPGAGVNGPPRIWDDNFSSLSPQVQLNAEMLQGLRASLARVEPARAEARRLIGMMRGRFPLEWMDDIWMTKLQSPDARTAANLLRHEAALAAQDGNADRALASVRGVLTAARSVGDEPLLLSALTRLACDAQATETLERALAQGEPSVYELEAVQALLEKEAAEPLLVQAMRGERAAMHKTLLSLRQGTTDLSELEWLSGSPKPRKSFLDHFGPTLARRSHASILRLMNEYVEASKLPLEKQPPAMQNLQLKVQQARQQFDIVTALIMPAMTKVAERYRRGVGNLRCAFVAAALERYRRKHGRWPETLDALVPNYLPAVPTDPQDGKPLRFKRRPDGVVVYSVLQQNPWAKGIDLGFQLWDMKQRRQPRRERLPAPREEVMP